MPQRKKHSVTVSKVEFADRLACVLAKHRKADLIEAIVEISRADRGIMRQFEMRFSVEAPLNELVVETRQAIIDATDFDEREINYNFDYDYQAYSAVKRNLERLIDLGHLHEVMQLSLELIKQGSHQVEMSDEGLMTDDIEACLQPVIRAMKKSNLSDNDVFAWCVAMTKTDSVGFICDTELQALRKKRESS